MTKQKTCVFNIIANDYYPQQQVFIRNFKKIHKDIDVYCISLENKDFKSNDFTTIKLKDIKNIPKLNFMTFKYNVLELATSVKPFIFSWIFDNYQYQNVLYFDSDILLYKSLESIISKLSQYDALLTPHIKEPINDDKRPNELDFNKSGYFNLGFIGFKKSQNVLTFLDWWGKRTSEHCYINFNKSYFVDQRWIDYAPLFLNPYIIKEPGYNVAYFNLHEYINKIDPKNIYFFHFSGFDEKKVSIHQTRFDSNSIGKYAKLFQDYSKELKKATLNSIHAPYSYAHFDNNVPISDYIRNIFKENTYINRDKLNTNNPYSVTGKNSIYHFITTQKSELAQTPTTALFESLYNNSPILQRTFPYIDFDYFYPTLYQYIKYVLKHNKYEYGIDDIFINTQKLLLDEIAPFLAMYKKGHFVHMRTFIKILQIKNLQNFTKNIYLFFLFRNPDPITIENIRLIKKPIKNIKNIKWDILIGILYSNEFSKYITTAENKSDIDLTKIRTKYKVVGKSVLFFT